MSNPQFSHDHFPNKPITTDQSAESMFSEEQMQHFMDEDTRFLRLLSPLDEVAHEAPDAYDPIEYYEYPQTSEAVDPIDLVPEETEVELDDRTQSLITATVGTGVIAIDQVIENSTEFKPEPSMGRIKEYAKKMGKRIAITGVAAAALAAWGFELGPWNESLRSTVGFNTFKASLDALKTGGAVFAATLPIEFIPAALVSLGLSRKNMPGRGVIEWMHRKLGAGDELVQERTKVDIAKDGSLALGVGAAAVVAKRFMTEKDMDFKKGLKTSAALAPVIAVFSGGVGWATAFGILHAQGSRFQGAADFLKNNGTDAKFWLAIFGGLQVMDFASKAIKNRKAKKQLEADQEMA